MTYVKILQHDHPAYGECGFLNDKPAREMIANGLAKAVEFTVEDFDAFIDRIKSGEKQHVASVAAGIATSAMRVCGMADRDSDEWSERLKSKILSDDDSPYPDADSWKRGLSRK